MERETGEKYTDPEETDRSPSGFTPSEPAGRRKKPPRKKRQYAAGLLALDVFYMAGAAGGIYLSRAKGPERPESLTYEVSIVTGNIPGEAKEEKQRGLDSMVEEGMIAMSTNAAPSGKAAGTSRGINWLIGSPSNQEKLIHVEVTLGEMGEKICGTGAVPPGGYVAETPPDMKLKAGVYEYTAMFYAYREETEEYIGQAVAKLKLALLK